MPTSVQTDDILHTIQDEHDRLEVLTTELRWTLLEPSPAHLQVVKELFDELVSLLTEHFAHEEQDGYFAELVAEQPLVAATVDRLQDEHRELLATVRAINARLQHANSTSVWFAAIMRDFSDFVRRCEHHQHEENRLTQETYLYEIGAGD